MADINKTLGAPSTVKSTTPAANTSAVATISKPAGGINCVYITGFIISATAAPAAAVEATITGPIDQGGSAVTLKFEIPAAAFAPITKDFGTHPLKCAPNTDAVLTLPALGGTTVGSVQLFGFYGPP